MLEQQAPVAGFWPSAWSAQQAAVAGREINELKVCTQGVLWSQTDPQTATTLLYRYQHSTQATKVFTPEGFSVRSRVYEYGGASFNLLPHGVVFTNETDQQIYLQPWQGAPQQLTDNNRCRYADMQFDAHSNSIIAIEEIHHDTHVEHRLISISLATVGTPSTHQITIISEGSDFYAAPRLSPNGQRLAWIEWQRPDQPWTQTRLLSAERHPDQSWSESVCRAGAAGDASLQQPLFDQDNRLVVLNDQDGYWQPWREEHTGDLAKLKGIAADYTGAPWQLGGCNYLPLGDDTYLISWLEHGTGKLALYDFKQSRTVQELAAGYSRLRNLAVDDNFIYCLAGHSAQGTAVLAIDRRTDQVQVLAQLSIGLTAQEISRPQSLYFPSTDNDPVHSFFYPPCNSAHSLQDYERPPLVVFLHGGPTSACYPVFDARIQFWTQRGFAVADLNYRGSTGFGRDYRQLLHQQWGIAEVEDVCALVRHLIANDWVNSQQMCVRGASAGGYTALLAIAASQDFAAAASLYGVSDPEALRKVTHKFEGDYLDWLLGSSEHFAARAPLERVAQINTPVIFFQGGRDVVVVPEQTADMVKALTEQGVTVDCHIYPEEGHGFRQAQHLAEVLELELAFYQRIFNQAAP